MNIATLAELWAGDTFITAFPFEDGTSVSVDRASLIRRTLTLTADPVFYQANRNLFTPFGNEIRVYSGITYADGTQELLLQGVFGIVDVNVDDSGADLVVTIDGSDRMRAIQRDSFTPDDFSAAAPVVPVPAGQNVGLVIQSIILSRRVGFTPLFNFTPVADATPAAPVTPNVGDDPAQFVSDLAASIGCELFVDPNGVFTMLPVPNPQYQPVSWVYAEGAQCILDDLNRTLSNATAANTIIRDGAGSGVIPPVRGFAQDTNPLSPTWVGGEYGEVVDYQSSSLYTTAAQAQEAANAALLVALGSTEAVTITAIPKPDSDIDDRVTVVRARAGVSADYVIDSFTIGIGQSGTVQATLRPIASILP